MDTTAAQRIFVGLFPDPAVQAALETHRRGWYWPPGSTQPRAHRLHLTLQFFAALDGERCAALRDALQALCFAPFELRLDRPEVWQHNGVAVLLPQPNAALTDLQARLAAIVAGLGLPATWPGRWQPHVTLARRASHAGPPDVLREVHWPVDEVRLVVSHHAPLWRYDVLARYPARPPSGPSE